MKYNFKDFQRQAVIRFLALEKYNYIREELYKCDVSKDEIFQKRFNSFFRVRRNETWRKKFYKYFEKNKNNTNITFDIIVKDLLLETGNIEASFSSKLLSTINPNMPIWDQYVLKNLGLEVEGKDKQERLDSTIKVYNDIIRIENDMLKQQDVKEAVRELKEEFKEYNLSDIKALDYLLWNSRDDED